MLLVGGGFRCKAVIFRQNRKPAKKEVENASDLFFSTKTYVHAMINYSVSLLMHAHR